MKLFCSRMSKTQFINAIFVFLEQVMFLGVYFAINIRNSCCQGCLRWVAFHTKTINFVALNLHNFHDRHIFLESMSPNPTFLGVIKFISYNNKVFVFLIEMCSYNINLKISFKIIVIVLKQIIKQD